MNLAGCGEKSKLHHKEGAKMFFPSAHSVRCGSIVLFARCNLSATIGSVYHPINCKTLWTP